MNTYTAPRWRQWSLHTLIIYSPKLNSSLVYSLFKSLPTSVLYGSFGLSSVTFIAALATCAAYYQSRHSTTIPSRPPQSSVDQRERAMHCLDGLTTALKRQLNRFFRSPRSRASSSSSRPTTVQRQQIGLPRNVRKEEDPFSSLLALSGNDGDQYVRDST